MFNCSRIPRGSLEMPLGRGRVCLEVDGESSFVTALCQAPPGAQRTLLFRSPQPSTAHEGAICSRLCVGGSAQRRVILIQAQSQTALLSQG